MIIKKLEARPSTAKVSSVNKCVTIIDKYQQQIRNDRLKPGRQSSASVLPTFAEMPSKDFSQLFYNKFTVKGLPLSRKSSPKRISTANRSQKKAQLIYIRQSEDPFDLMKARKREETLIGSEFQSFFREVRDGTTPSRHTLPRPVTAKRQAPQNSQLKNRPVTAVKPKHDKTPQKTGKLSQKETRIESSLSSSVLFQEKMFFKAQSPIRVIEGIEDLRTQSPKGRNVADQFNKTLQPEHIQPESIPTTLTETAPSREQAAQCLQDAISKNNKHLKYLEQNSITQYKKFLAAAEENQQSRRRLDCQLLQFNNSPVKEQSEKLNYYIQLANYIENMEDRINKTIKNPIMKGQQKQPELSNVLFNMDEYERILELFSEQPRDYEKLDDFLIKMQPLRILTKQRRLQIMSISTIIQVKAQQRIIEEDSVVKYLYMIVKGSVQKYFYQKICSVDTLLTKSLFDGQVFGMAQGDPPGNLYSYSIVATEDCTFLRMPIREYLSIQSEFLKSELSDKVDALKELDCFRDLSAKDLIPMATLLTQKRYDNGEIILKEGDKANNFYIMTKGSATIVKQQLMVRKKQAHPSAFANAMFQSCNSLNNLRKPVPIKKSKKFISDYAQSNRKYKLVAQDERKFAYYYYHEFKDVRKGQQLVYRAVKGGIDLTSESQSSPGSANSNPLKLSVIANSNDCECFILSSNDVRKIPEYLLRPLLKYCEQHIDFDDFFNDKQQKKLKQWERYKVRMCQEVINAKINSKA